MHTLHAIHHREAKHWTAGKIFLVCFLLVAIGAMIFYIASGKSGKNILQTVLVGRGDVVQEVVVTGRIKPVYDISLAFENGGKISQVFANIGDKVLPGQPLVQLDTSEISAQLMQAEAGVESAQARLNEIKRGTRIEELQIKETDLAKAREDLASYYTNIPSVLNDAYAKASDAVRSKTDGLFINDDTANPQPTFTVTNSQVQVDFISGRIMSGQEINTWKTELGVATPDADRVMLENLLIKAQTHLSIINNFLAVALDAVSNASGLSSADVTTYKANIGVGRTNVNSALSSILSQTQLISGQKITVTKAERDLALDKAGSTPEQIAEQAAIVKQAEANKQSIDAQIAKMTLHSPIAGLVTKEDAKPGEIVAAQTALVSIISQNNLEIEANVPEVDIGRVAISNPVSITLDAFPGETFNGKVSYIDPGETIIDGVVNFKVTMVFLAPDERFKTGLTANLSIETMKKTGVVIVPQFAIVENDNGIFARKVSGTAVTEVPITIGIRSKDGNVEVISGLREGDRVENVGFKPR
ncbi:MAG: efflux RND transporter periplasmic adaptor subunit [Candidatus Jorgensenbacteria bacterium]|nr:efflux RND transporter periplasmic adaptor subunit [Candidatus Jorgensenbacteria bacterium]